MCAPFCFRSSVCVSVTEVQRRRVELTCGAARRDGRTADPAVAPLCSQLQHTPPSFPKHTHTHTHDHAVARNPPRLQPRKEKHPQKHKNTHWSFSAACRVRRPHPAEVRLFFSGKHFSVKKKKIILRGEWEERRSCDDTIKGGNGEGLWDGVTEWRERRRGEE